MSDSDQYYIQRCLAGEAEKFGFLVSRYQAGVTAFLAGKLGNKSLAEEAAQETFVRAYFGLGKLKDQKVFHSWLLGIADRVAKEQLRGLKKESQFEIQAEQANPESKPDMELEKAIARMPETFKEIIYLRFYADMSCLQISQKLRMPIGTVTKRLSRAYENLRNILKENQEVQK